MNYVRTNRQKQQLRRPRVPRKSIPCGYCFQEWATAYDHLIPWSAGGTEDPSNLYPTCRRCNSILSNKIFDSVEAKREYIRNYRKLEGTWDEPSESINQEIALTPEEEPRIEKKKEAWVIPTFRTKKELREWIRGQLDTRQVSK